MPLSSSRARAGAFGRESRHALNRLRPRTAGASPGDRRRALERGRRDRPGSLICPAKRLDPSVPTRGQRSLEVAPGGSHSTLAATPPHLEAGQGTESLVC